jgi:DNA-directed RNA polymerase specialized sigma24 family protein
MPRNRLQETLLAAWRGLERFDGRCSLQIWLYRIATDRRRNALRDKGRRPRRVEPLAEPPEPTRRGEPIWLEPYPDALLGAAADTSPGPEARYELKEAVSLAFVAASSSCRRDAGRCSCCATYSVSERRRSRRCSRRAKLW